MNGAPSRARRHLWMRNRVPPGQDRVAKRARAFKLPAE